MDTVLREPWTVDSFLAWEDRQEGKHEFDGSGIVPMTGGSRAHQRLMRNLANLLEACLGPEYDVLHEMRVRLGNAVRYPDVAVCRAPVPDQTKTLSDAIAVFEVLSDDTAATDRRAKPGEYARLPGIRYFVLLAQDRMAVEVLRLSGGVWQPEPASATTLALPEIGVSLPLADLYAGLRLGAEPE